MSTLLRFAGVFANASNREPAGGWNEGAALDSAACFAGLSCEVSGTEKLVKTFAEFRSGDKSGVGKTLVKESGSSGSRVSDDESVEEEGSFDVRNSEWSIFETGPENPVIVAEPEKEIWSAYIHDLPCH